MNIPKDPYILFSYINTQLRDNYGSLEAFCGDAEISPAEITEKLAAIGYRYDEEKNAFIPS